MNILVSVFTQIQTIVNVAIDNCIIIGLGTVAIVLLGV